jgi:hypothetical protein
MEDFFSNFSVKLSKDQLDALIRSQVLQKYPEHTVSTISYKIQKREDFRGESLGSDLVSIEINLTSKKNDYSSPR